jgi:hypothetical protein
MKVMTTGNNDGTTLTIFQEATLLSDMENTNLQRPQITLGILSSVNREKDKFYSQRKLFHDKLWNYKRMSIKRYARVLAAHDVRAGTGTIREIDGILDSVPVVKEEQDGVDSGTVMKCNEEVTSPATLSSASSASSASSSKNPSSASSCTASSSSSNSSNTTPGSNFSNHSTDLNEELENMTQTFTHVNLKEAPSFSVKGKQGNKQSHCSTTGRNNIMTPPNSPPPRSNASEPTSKHSNMTPAAAPYTTPPRTTRTIASSAGSTLSSSSDSSRCVRRDPFAYDPNATDYKGSKSNPFITFINTKCPEQNEYDFFGSYFDVKRSHHKNGDEYMLSGVVVTKTGNAADIVDLDLWKASIPQPGDFGDMSDNPYVGRSLLVTICARDILQRDPNKLNQEADCDDLLIAHKATAERYNAFGSESERHKKYYLLVFEKEVNFAHLSNDPDCLIVETHSNMATFAENYHDAWDKVASTTHLGMTNAYWEVPFADGRRKLETKKTPKKLTAAERIAQQNAAKLKTPDQLN